MDLTPLGQMIFWIRKAHQEVIKLVEGLSDQQLAWQPNPSTTSIAFNVWHLARWADYVQWRMPDATLVLGQRLESRPQVWHAEGLASKWGLDPAGLGDMEAGTSVGVAAANLRFPGQTVLLEYLRRCYTLEEQTLAALDDQEFQERRLVGAEWPEETVGQWLMSHLIHEWEHLGMIRSLKGLQDSVAT